jgi:TolB-like protein/Tfp pilus assembly protein PilF
LFFLCAAQRIFLSDDFKGTTIPTIVNDRPLLITVHGIRTGFLKRGWQRELETLAAPDCAAESVKYGFLPAFLFLFPAIRRRRVRWLKEEWTHYKEKWGVIPSVIAHSFGTYLVAEAMSTYPEMKFDRVVLCGSIVETHFPWKGLHDRDQFHKLLNQYGGVDHWTDIVQWAVPKAGPSGKRGFASDPDTKDFLFQESHPEWGHGDYFYQENYRRWLDFISGKPLAEYRPIDRGKYRNIRPLVLLAFVLAVVIIAGVIRFCPPTEVLFHDHATPAKNRVSPAPNTTIITVPQQPVLAKSIAILPFENLSNDESNAYLASGIQEQILSRLAKIGDLKVISRTSTEKYKSVPSNLREIGIQLGVATVLEGSLQKSNGEINITVALMRANDETTIWSETYRRTLYDIFSVEGELARSIAEHLNAKLTGAEQVAITEKPTQNATAYDAYLRGLSLERDRVNYKAYQTAVAAYSDAVQIDPKFAVAWAHLAIVRARLFSDGVDTNASSADAVKYAVNQAMSLQPLSGEAWVALGAYRHRVLRDYANAHDAYKEAQTLLPNSSLVLQHLAFVERRLGLWSEAEINYNKAAELDPRDFGLFVSMAEELFTRLRQFGDAHAALDRALDISPDDQNAIASRASVFQNEGRLPEAAKQLARIPANSVDPVVVLTRLWQAEYERRFDDAIALLTPRVNSIQPGESIDVVTKEFLVQLGYCQEWAGRTDDARNSFANAVDLLRRSGDSFGPDSVGSSFFLSRAYAGLGDKTNALEQAYRTVTDLQSDAVFKPLAEAILAQIQARFGDLDGAVALVPQLLKVPSDINESDLRYNPMWDPLRKDPRFQELARTKP